MSNRQQRKLKKELRRAGLPKGQEPTKKQIELAELAKQVGGKFFIT